MKQIDLYFDFISPYAYLVFQKLDSLPADYVINPRPILLAGLLKHYETRGPGEIAPMRNFVYRQIQWLADRDGIPLRFPPIHPFNPLKLLRLCIANGGDIELVKRIFFFVWGEGKASDNDEHWRQLLGDIDITPQAADNMVQDPVVKTQLIQNTEAAIELGLFGVPAFVVGGEVFWGYDAMQFVCDYVDDPDLFKTEGMVRADNVGSGVVRR